MSYSPLSMSRRHVLGDLYARCEEISESIPVYLTENEPERIGEPEPEVVGHADEGLGHYADALTFHLSDELCKRLSAGHFTYTFEYEFADPRTKGPRARVRISSISLIARQNYKKPEPRGSLVRVQASDPV